jgi:CRISPR-associated endonuclease Cas1
MKAYLETEGSIVRLESEHLSVFSNATAEKPGGELLTEIPLFDLDEVVVDETVHISAPALTALLKRGIPVHFIDFKGSINGSSLPAPAAEAACRLLQYQRAMDSCRFVIQTARNLIEAKIYNQRRILQRLNTGHSQPIDETLARMDNLLLTLYATHDLQQILGCEGASTAAYFGAWQLFLPARFPFVQRSARPPRNPVNACISYAASLVYHELVTTLHIRGLDPGLGTLHRTENGRWSLALDLMEPFRPCVAEALAMRLFKLGMFDDADFQPHNGGIYLSRDGRRKFIREYEFRMQRTFFSEHYNHRTTMRQVLRDEATAYKACLSPDGAEFKPFHMN